MPDRTHTTQHLSPMPRDPSSYDPSSPDNLSDIDSSLYHESSRPPWLPLLVFIPIILPLFWTYRVEFTGEELTVGYNTSMCSKTFKVTEIDDIRECQVYGMSADWGGWGIRWSLGGGGWGYICRDGSAVSLRDATNNTKYTFSCHHPQQLIAQLRRAWSTHQS